MAYLVPFKVGRKARLKSLTHGRYHGSLHGGLQERWPLHGLQLGLQQVRVLCPRYWLIRGSAKPPSVERRRLLWGHLSPEWVHDMLIQSEGLSWHLADNHCHSDMVTLKSLDVVPWWGTNLWLIHKFEKDLDYGIRKIFESGAKMIPWMTVTRSQFFWLKKSKQVNK